MKQTRRDFWAALAVAGAALWGTPGAQPGASAQGPRCVFVDGAGRRVELSAFVSKVFVAGPPASAMAAA